MEWDVLRIIKLMNSKCVKCEMQTKCKLDSLEVR
jgi:hypothetical protein